MIKKEPTEDEDWSSQFEKRMQLMGFKPKPDDNYRIFTSDRNRLWKSLLQYVHPVSEVEKVMKNLAIKKYQNKLMLNSQLGAKLCQKKEEIKLKEYHFEETKQELRALECKLDQEWNKIKELKKKMLLLEFKKAELNGSLQHNKDIVAVALLLQKNSASQPVDAVEAHLLTAAQDLAKFHKMVREKSNKCDLETVKETIIEQMRNIPIIESLGILLKQMECQAQELHSAKYSKEILQDLENIKCSKNAYRFERDKFLIAFVNAQLEQNKLVKQFELKKEVHNTLLDSAVKLIQERFKFDSSSGSTAEIRKWLTVKLKCERKKAAIETCKKELNLLKAGNIHSDVRSTEEISDLGNEIQMKVNSIRMTIPWLQDSLKKTEIVHSELQTLMTEITKLCTQEAGKLKEMEKAIKSMPSITEDEMDLFMAIPLDKLTFSPVEFEKHQLVRYNSACSSRGSSFMMLLDGAPDITNQGILLRALEKKFRRCCLKRICLEKATPLIQIDKNNLMKIDEVDDAAILQNLERTRFSFEMNSNMLLEEIEKNHKEWVEHPMQYTLLHKTLEGRTFEEWMYEYDRIVEE